ncbi:hypothetical protein BDQ17DRAFT_625494 [Cyathus striatus]|nr:hypothetical protein BDQ17DRAFT_625494 [Cyathus striatus]
MPEALGFKASTGNSEVLPEFSTEIDLEKREVRSWVPSEAGKIFDICWQSVGCLTMDTNGSVHVDGIDVGGLLSLDPRHPHRVDTSTSWTVLYQTRGFGRAVQKNIDHLISKCSIILHKLKFSYRVCHTCLDSGLSHLWLSVSQD